MDSSLKALLICGISGNQQSYAIYRTALKQFIVMYAGRNVQRSRCQISFIFWGFVHSEFVKEKERQIASFHYICLCVCICVCVCLCVSVTVSLQSAV